MNSVTEGDSFIWQIFHSFFSNWWIFITGFASLLSWLSFPESGVSVPRYLACTITLVASLLVFLTISAVYNSWRLFKQLGKPLRVTGLQTSQHHDGQFIFLLEGPPHLSAGQILELRRTTSGLETLLGLIEILERNSKGVFQARAIWLSPIHQLDLKQQKFSTNDISATEAIGLRSAQKAKDALILEASS